LSEPLEPEQLAPALVGTGAEATVENAKRLGLTWTLRLATVLNGTDPVNVLATYDGDTAVISMTSMVGPLVAGQRVYVVQVPPSGNFITGFITPLLSAQYGVRARVSNAQAIPNAAQTSLIWNVIDQEVGGNFIAAGGTLFTIPITGLWTLHLRTLLGNGGARNFLNYFVTTGIASVFPSNVRSNYIAGESTASLSTTIPLLAGDTITASVYQEGGATTASAYISIFRVGEYTE